MLNLVSCFLLSVYLSGVLGFSFVTHPVSCCFLLVVSGLSFCSFVYLLIGFSWYLLLFCLVYVGGVYILFVYVSMYSPNLFVGLGHGFGFVFFSFFLFFTFFYCLFLGSYVFSDVSHYICSWGDGYGYCFFCLVLLVGFSLVSLVSFSKDSFFR